MEMVVCSQCYTRVIPMRGGTCPSCRGTIGGPSPYEPIVVRSGARLPPHCVGCDLETDLGIPWKAAASPGRDASFAHIGLISTFLGVWNKSRELEVSLDIPLCRECKLPATPRADFENALVEIVVDRRVAARLRAQSTEPSRT
jgi:hypothetical protein